MKKAPAPTKTQGAAGLEAGHQNFAGHDAGPQAEIPAADDLAGAVMRAVGHVNCRAARRATLRLPNDLSSQRLTRVGRELRWMFGRGFIVNYRAARAATHLIDALDQHAGEPAEIDAPSFEKYASECLNDLVESIAGGFGDFDVHFQTDGTLAFVGEADAASLAMLRLDQRRTSRRKRADQPRVFFAIPSTGELLYVWSLNHAFDVLKRTKAASLDMHAGGALQQRALRREGV